jgi:hypothetical protein
VSSTDGGSSVAGGEPSIVEEPSAPDRTQSVQRRATNRSARHVMPSRDSRSQPCLPSSLASRSGAPRLFL